MAPSTRKPDEQPPYNGDKLAILWDSRHDCDNANEALKARVLVLETWMIQEQTKAKTAEKSSAWTASVCTGLILIAFTLVKDLVLKNWG